MISLNAVYQFVDEYDRIRIVYVDNDLCAYVHINWKLSMPKVERISIIEEQYDNNHIVQVNDPYFGIKSDNDLSEIEVQKRDAAWQMIQKYWESNKNDILDKKTRMQIFEEISQNEGISLMTVRRTFSRFWQRGMTRNALLPDYFKSGGKGKEKNITEKMGARRIHGNDSEGIIITKEVKDQFEASTERYRRTGQKKSLRQVYRAILADYYSITVKTNAELGKILLSDDSLPTYNQYYYWFKKNENPTLDIKSQEGEKEYELKHRPLQSNSTVEAPGPGFRFQIDSTPIDAHIVSEADRNAVIGRPILYIIIDVFSRMITGVYIGLEAASWNGAMMALDSMVADKVELCRKYNVNISHEDWPCLYVPKIIIADRGEMKGHGVDNLINNLHIEIENTSPYRGDLKGIVERYFRTVNERIRSTIPGAIMKDFRKRGDPDYRLAAKLTLKEISEIVIRCVLLHNIQDIEKYPLSSAMIRDDVLPTPISLWNWGIANKKGSLRIIDQHRFRMNILPRGKASINRGALIFNKRRYGATKLLDESFFQRLKLRSLEIVYDPRNVDNIFLLQGDRESSIVLNLLDTDRDYKEMFWEDVIFINKRSAMLHKTAKKSQLQQEIELDQKIMKISKESTKNTNKEIDPTVSKRKRIEDIGPNRAEEKDRNRKKEAFMPETIQNDLPASIIPFPNDDSHNALQNEPRGETSDYNSRMMEKIRQRKEKLRNDENDYE
ncbi:MAG: DDE-type integrase/transposase/recombinase [Parabacteroides sp.]|nr:DDE-type integrase/transposase/recombinase [Parabacteroides sp.]